MFLASEKIALQMFLLLVLHARDVSATEQGYGRLLLEQQMKAIHELPGQVNDESQQDASCIHFTPFIDTLGWWIRHLSGGKNMETFDFEFMIDGFESVTPCGLLVHLNQKERFRRGPSKLQNGWMAFVVPRDVFEHPLEKTLCSEMIPIEWKLMNGQSRVRDWIIRIRILRDDRTLTDDAFFISDSMPDKFPVFYRELNKSFP